MGIIDIFKNRLSRAPKLAVQVSKDELPLEFKRQVIHIWVSAIGTYRSLDPIERAMGGSRRPLPPSNAVWGSIERDLLRELGLFQLTDNDHDDAPLGNLQRFLLAADTPHALSVIELSFRYLDEVVRGFDVMQRHRSHLEQDPDSAIAELNERFRRHGLGYAYLDGQIVRVDSTYVHEEVTEPGVVLLHDAGFDGPREEFMRAHGAYRAGNFREAIREISNSLESTMKAIADHRAWTYPANATASVLIDLVFDKGLIDKALQAEFGALQALFKSGLPTIRNRRAGHGQGKDPVDVPEHLAAFALHMGAAKIVFLVRAHRALS